MSPDGNVVNNNRQRHEVTEAAYHGQVYSEYGMRVTWHIFNLTTSVPTTNQTITIALMPFNRCTFRSSMFLQYDQNVIGTL